MKKDRFLITLWIGNTPFSKGCRNIGEVADALEAAVGRPMNYQQFKAILLIGAKMVSGNKTAECDLTSAKAPMRVTLAYNAQ